jgi:hypothetical protein
VTTPPLFNIVLGSANPERLYAWYRAALAPEDTGTEHIDAKLLLSGQADPASPELASKLVGDEAITHTAETVGDGRNLCGGCGSWSV